MSLTTFTRLALCVGLLATMATVAAVETAGASATPSQTAGTQTVYSAIRCQSLAAGVLCKAHVRIALVEGDYLLTLNKFDFGSNGSPSSCQVYPNYVKGLAGVFKYIGNTFPNPYPVAVGAGGGSVAVACTGGEPSAVTATGLMLTATRTTFTKEP